MRLSLSILTSILFLFSCNPKSPNSSFVDNLKEGDTLFLLARFSDCGEWGGHPEEIFLTKNENKLTIYFYKENGACKGYWIKKNEMEKSKLLSSQDRKTVIGYIEKVIFASKENQNVNSNALNYFIIKNKDTIIRFNDWERNWANFEIMRDEIF